MLAEERLNQIKNVIREEEFNTIKRSLDDVKYNLCGEYADESNGKVIAKLTEDWINGSNADKTAYVKHLTQNAHRFLQSEFFMVLLTIIKSYSEYNDYMFDGRNEWIKDKVQEITKNCPDTFNYVQSIYKKVE